MKENRLPPVDKRFVNATGEVRLRDEGLGLVVEVDEGAHLVLRELSLGSDVKFLGRGRRGREGG